MRAPLLPLLLLAALAAPAGAAPPPDAARAPAAVKRRPPVPTRTAPGPARPGAPGKRVLDDVHIEGEIPMPQVLFITARDQRRFSDFAHRRYLPSSRVVAERTVPVTWTVVTNGLPSEARKESDQ